MRKMTRAIFGMILSCVSLSTFANGKDCNLGEWCLLERASDYANVLIYNKDGTRYTCTLSVDGTFNSIKVVQVNISGRQGFDMNPIVLSTHQGGSAQVHIKGSFIDRDGDPIIRVRRLTSDNLSSTNERSYIMCEIGTR